VCQIALLETDKKKMYTETMSLRGETTKQSQGFASQKMSKGEEFVMINLPGRILNDEESH